MKTNKLLQLIQEQGGATLTKSLRAKSFNKGYQVALHGTEAIIDYTSPLFKAIIKAQQKQLAKGEYLGLWLNEENGKVYIDKSIYIANRSQAIKLAKDNKQISILNWATMKTIKTN
jgi:hypothetical protein